MSLGAEHGLDLVVISDETALSVKTPSQPERFAQNLAFFDSIESHRLFGLLHIRHRAFDIPDRIVLVKNGMSHPRLSRCFCRWRSGHDLPLLLWLFGAGNGSFRMKFWNLTIRLLGISSNVETCQFSMILGPVATSSIAAL